MPTVGSCPCSNLFLICKQLRFTAEDPRKCGRADVGLRCLSAALFRSQGVRHNTQAHEAAVKRCQKMSKTVSRQNRNWKLEAKKIGSDGTTRWESSTLASSIVFNNCLPTGYFNNWTALETKTNKVLSQPINPSKFAWTSKKRSLVNEYGLIGTVTCFKMLYSLHLIAYYIYTYVYIIAYHQTRASNSFNFGRKRVWFFLQLRQLRQQLSMRSMRSMRGLSIFWVKWTHPGSLWSTGQRRLDIVAIVNCCFIDGKWGNHWKHR